MFFKKSKRETSGNAKRAALGSRKRRLLAETVHIEEELVPTFVRPTLFVVAAMLILFLLWAGFARLTEVARAPGEIIPSGQNKVVQHLDGGVVTQIFGEEHMLVKEGQILLRMEGSQAMAELGQMEARLVALRLRAERLQAFAEDRPPKFDTVVGQYSHLLSDQQEIYTTQMATRVSTLSILDRQIAQRTNRVGQLEKALKVARQHQDLTGELSSMREDLASRRLINRTVLLETRRAKVTAEGEVARLNDEISITSQELAEARNRRTDTVNQLRREALAEMGMVRAEMAEAEEALQRLQARVDRLVVRAPSRGFVHDLKVLTVGQVVQPGALLMQIVPDNAPMEAMIRIAPRDIGYVREGQRVNMRVTSFDYARFGFAKGTLKRVTASSVVGEDGKPYYRGWVTLAQPYVGNVPGRYPVRAGMSVEADILTGEKTMLAYLTKPLIDVLSRAFQER